MSDTAAAVESVVAEAFSPPVPAAPEPVLRRDELREQIITNSEWKDEPALVAERQQADPPVEGEATDAPATDAPAPAAETTTAETTTAETTTAETTAPTEPPPEAVIGDGATRIVVRTSDGKFTPAPDVKLEFTVGDKVYTKSPAELVRMARDGVAGQQYVQKAKEYEQQFPVLQQQLQSMQQELDAQAALNRELLDDEDAYYTRRAEWQEMNSPEARLARYEQERHQEHAQRRAYEQTAQQQQVVMTYYQQELKPVQDELLNNFPEVTLEAKMGKLTMDTLPLMQNGVIPPHRLPEYKAYLEGPFREWVKQEAASIAKVNAEREAKLQQTIQQEQRRAQQVVQSVGRQTVPAGRAAPDAPPAPRAPRNRDEAKAMIIGRPWQE